MPEDLFFAIMRIPGDYRDLLARHGSLEEIDDLLRDRHDPTAWSALERVAHVADSMHISAKCMVALLDEGRATYTSVHVDAARAGSNSVPSRAVLASLGAAAADLARAMTGVSGVGWDRRVRLGNRSTTVRDVVEDALRDAHHHLADVAELLDTAERLHTVPHR